MRIGISHQNEIGNCLVVPSNEAGNVPSADNRALLPCLNLKGVPQDYKTAIKLYTLPAEQGNALAQYNLGIMHSFGLGVI